MKNASIVGAAKCSEEKQAFSKVRHNNSIIPYNHKKKGTYFTLKVCNYGIDEKKCCGLCFHFSPSFTFSASFFWPFVLFCDLSFCHHFTVIFQFVRHASVVCLKCFFISFVDSFQLYPFLSGSATVVKRPWPPLLTYTKIMKEKGHLNKELTSPIILYY